MLIDRLYTVAPSRLAMVDRDGTVQSAVSSLSQPGIGLVIVCSDTGAAGVLTKSDIVRHLSNAGSARECGHR
jgi:CBS domain-containing protein